MGILDKIDPDPERKEKSEQQREAAYSRWESTSKSLSRRSLERFVDSIRLVGVGGVKLYAGGRKVLGGGLGYVFGDDSNIDWWSDSDQEDDRDDGRRWGR